MNNGVKELWAIVYKSDGTIAWSRGGSSTSSRIMVYDNQKSAERALRSVWTKQVIDSEDVGIECIYTARLDYE